MAEPLDCKHGHQARKCLTCELEAENAELRAEVAEGERSMREMAASLRALFDAMIRYQDDVDGDPPWQHREMMRTAGALLARIEGGVTSPLPLEEA